MLKVFRWYAYIMKNKTFMKIIPLILTTIALFVPVAFAAAALESPLQNISSFSKFIEEVIQIVLRIGIPIASLAIIYSGFLFITAQGSDDKLTEARKALTWSLIGTAVLLGSWVLAGAIGSTITALKG